jgi:hypothetical protein
MRRCFAVLAATLAAAGALTVPALSSAAPHQDKGLTIIAKPSSIVAGQGVLIYGQLSGPKVAHQPIVLFHRINPRPFFTIIGVTRTNANGYYQFIRPEGIVLTNRSWFVRGPNGTHSLTVHEEVQALVSLNADSTNAITGQRVLFTGHVTPDHPFQRVLLQEQNSLSGNGWATIATAFTGGGSNFVIPHHWARPGDYTLRVVLPADPRNVWSSSDTVTIDVQQRQRPDFTISTPEPIVPVGTAVTISGVLDQQGTTTALPTTEVTLWESEAGGSWHAVSTSVTGTGGGYSFTQSPIHNTAYQVRVTLKPHRATAVLYQGIQDTLTLNASTLTGEVGNTVTLSGNVTPNHVGHLIYLQRLGLDGNWHAVAATLVQTGSSFSFSYVLTQTGSVELRARITGGPENAGAASSAVTITVNGVVPVITLPTTS